MCKSCIAVFPPKKTLRLVYDGFCLQTREILPACLEGKFGFNLANARISGGSVPGLIEFNG